ncbi:MAG: SPOR domain-containing protein [Desulfobacteraceae bacterium]|nr:SPOR domain-containing protein [Desulfobacteraceae bacterium]
MNKINLFAIMFLFVMLPQMILFQGCVSNNVHHIKAQKLENMKDYDLAVKYWAKALQENPGNLDAKLGLKHARQKASIFHMYEAEKLLEKKYFKKAIEELQVSISFYPGNTRAIELIHKAKRMKQSQYYFNKGNQQIKIGDYKNARDSFQKAFELDLNNKEAEIALAYFKKRAENLPVYRVDYRSNAPISLKFKKTPVINVFEIISKLSGINFIFDKDVKESKVTLFMTDVSFDKFLEVLLKTNSLKAKLINRKTMLIYPDTSAKAKEYEDLYVKTFYLSYLESKDAVIILSKMLKSKNITPNKKLNTVTVRAQRNELELAARIIEANDRTPSEVIMNVEILEVSRSTEKDLGLSISDTITFGVSETSSGINYDPAFGFTSMGSLEDIGNISSKELYLSLPTATLKLLKQHGDTKTLAKPQIRVSSSEKASILIGERVPIRTNRKVQTDGTTTYDFQYQDVGIKLTVEPVINMYDQITMKLNIEVSALSSNVGTSDDPQYAIKTRTVTTVMTINDGDNVIIGGLIQDEDRKTTRKIPLAGDMPMLGRFFSSKNSEVVERDILMSITPVIIRRLDVPNQEIAEFWSGTQKQASLEEPEEEKIKKETDFNDLPNKDFIKVMKGDEFLPNNNYFSIQVYSSKGRTDAENWSDKLKEQGYDNWIRPAEIKGKGTFYRVFVGQYASYMLAEHARLKMIQTDTFPKDIHIVDRDYVYK